MLEDDEDEVAVDPWSQGYAIRLDSDHDGQVVVGDQLVPTRWAVWSFGRNRRNEEGMGDDLRPGSDAPGIASRLTLRERKGADWDLLAA